MGILSILQDSTRPTEVDFAFADVSTAGTPKRNSTYLILWVFRGSCGTRSGHLRTVGPTIWRTYFFEKVLPKHQRLFRPSLSHFDDGIGMPICKVSTIWLCPRFSYHWGSRESFALDYASLLNYHDLENQLRKTLSLSFTSLPMITLPFLRSSSLIHQAYYRTRGHYGHGLMTKLRKRFPECWWFCPR